MTKLGGDTPVRIARNIAFELWTREGLKDIIIGGKRSNKKNSEDGSKKKFRAPADPERNELYDRALKIALGSQYTTALHTEVTRLVNQTGIDRRKMERRSSNVSPQAEVPSGNMDAAVSNRSIENKENENPIGLE